MSTAIANNVNGELLRDPAVGRVTIRLNTEEWSTRKKKILIEAVRKGISDCGGKTAEIVSDLCRQYETGPFIHIHQHGWAIPTKELDPDRLDEIIAQVAASLKLAAALEDAGRRSRGYMIARGRYGKIFLDSVERGETPPAIIVGHMSYQHRWDFAAKYIRPATPEQQANKTRLIEAVRAGETLTVDYT